MSVEKLFQSHQPSTELRKLQQEQINYLALQFAKYIDENVLDKDCKKQAIFSILQAKMFASHGVAVDELRVN